MSKTFQLARLLIVFTLLFSVTHTYSQIVSEDKVPPYTLPDPLTFLNGSKVKTKEDWKKRRSEILEMCEREMYGRHPGRPANMRFKVFDIDENALNGKAIRKQVTVSFSDSINGPSMDVLIYYPKNVKGRVPVFLGLNFQGNHGVSKDPGINFPLTGFGLEPQV